MGGERRCHFECGRQSECEFLSIQPKGKGDGDLTS